MPPQYNHHHHHPQFIVTIINVIFIIITQYSLFTCITITSVCPQGSREQLAIAEFAHSLLVIPKILAVNAAQDSADLVAKLRAFHNTSQINAERSHLKWYVNRISDAIFYWGPGPLNSFFEGGASLCGPHSSDSSVVVNNNIFIFTFIKTLSFLTQVITAVVLKGKI